MLNDRRLTEALINSVSVAVLSSAVAVLLGFLAAYGLARFRLPGTGVQRAFIVAPFTVSYLIIGLGLLISFNTLGFRSHLLRWVSAMW